MGIRISKPDGSFSVLIQHSTGIKLPPTDNIVKVAPNDPFMAWAILGAMMDVDPDHPVTKHFSTVFWPKDMPDFENELIQPRYFEKIISWGGALGGVNSTLNHGSLQASSIDVITLGPKFSISILSSEAFQTPETIEHVASHTGELSDFFPTHKVVFVIPFIGDPLQVADRIHPSTQTVGVFQEH